MDPRPTLGIFLKAPRPGHVKTRLEPRVGAEGAASLYTAFLGDTVTLATESSAQHVVFFHDGPAPSGLGTDPARTSRHAQGPGNLGDRLAEAARQAGEESRFPLLFLGSDSPDLPPDRLEDALDAVCHYDVVLGPAEDGGVWCIGLRRPVPGFFADLPWSSVHTARALRNRADSLGLNLRSLRPWMDVDDPDDLDALIHRLTRGESSAPQTLAWIHERGLAPRGDLP